MTRHATAHELQVAQMEHEIRQALELLARSVPKFCRLRWAVAEGTYGSLRAEVGGDEALMDYAMAARAAEIAVTNAGLDRPGAMLDIIHHLTSAHADRQPDVAWDDEHITTLRELGLSDLADEIERGRPVQG